MSSSHPEGPILISSIAVEVRPKFNKPVDNITFQVGGFRIDIPHKLSPGNECKEAFNPPLKLSPREQLSVSMQYDSGWFGRRTLCITMKQEKVVKRLRDNGQGITRCLKFHRNILVTIVPAASGSSGEVPPRISHSPLAERPSLHVTTDGAPRDAPLALTTSQGSYAAPLTPSASKDPNDDPVQPTTDEILHICPRFRLLVIGNTGVGKSTLIQKVFGVKDVVISEDSRGRADIDRELIAAENGLFVVHDSMGLEAGDGKNFDKVKRFIDERRAKEDLKDRLHAVWMCLAVPYAKGRLLEAGMEEFLKNRKKVLGDIPLVVVLTKVDLLDNLLLRTLRNEGVEIKTIAEAAPIIAPRRSKFINESCTGPLRLAGGDDVPHTAVSTTSGYGLEGTIPELVKITTSEIRRVIKAGLASAAVTESPNIAQNAQLYVAEMAQRASYETNVDLSIEIGKKRYWRNLGASISPSAKKVEDYLLAIHQDIILIWNLHDPEGILQSNRFKMQLLEMSTLEANGNQPENGQRFALSWSTMGGDPIAAVVTLFVEAAILLVGIHKASKAIAKRFMAYIVDCLYVMEILFILTSQRPVTPDDVDLALKIYAESHYRSTIHAEIQDFSVDYAILPGGRDMVMERIVELIKQITITEEDVSRVRGQTEVASR